MVICIYIYSHYIIDDYAIVKILRYSTHIPAIPSTRLSAWRPSSSQKLRLQLSCDERNADFGPFHPDFFKSKGHGGKGIDAPQRSTQRQETDKFKIFPKVLLFEDMVTGST